MNNSKVQEVSVPFFYWSSGNRENTGREDPLSLCGMPIEKCPDAKGRFVIPITEADRHKRVLLSSCPLIGTETQWQYIQRASDRIEQALKQRSGYEGFFFRLFVPLSTRTIGHTFKSLFPFNTGLKHRAAQGDPVDFTWQKGLLRLALAIADIVTMPFRLLSLIPRAIYQHFLQKNHLIDGVRVEADRTIDWGHGFLMIHLVNVRTETFRYNDMQNMCEVDRSIDKSVESQKNWFYLGS